MNIHRRHQISIRRRTRGLSWRDKPMVPQSSHPAFIEAAAREKAIGINPKYLHQAARRRLPADPAEWEASHKAWKQGYAGEIAF